MIKKIENLPIGIVGTTLGLCTLSNAYFTIGFKWIRIISMFFALLVWFVFTLKIVFHFRKVKEEYLGSTVTATLYSTYSMLLMVLSSFIVEFFNVLGSALWLIAITIQIALTIIIYILHTFKYRNIDMLLPSLYVPVLGLDVATAIGNNMNFPILKKIIVIYGFIMYFLMIIPIIYRLKIKSLPFESRFTKAILCAPISLLIIGYINVFNAPNKIFLMFLVLILLSTYVYVFSNVFSFFKGGFAPGYAALTFPMAIVCIALLKASASMQQNNLISEFLKQFAGIQISLTTGIIFFTLVNYLGWGLRNLNGKKIVKETKDPFEKFEECEEYAI